MKTWRMLSLALLAVLLVALPQLLRADAPAPAAAKASPAASASPAPGADIVTAVKWAAAKDCGCKKCSSSGCKPCHGHNCFYCVAKGLVTDECGCGSCSPKGCPGCGPGCDTCKFHLAPVAESGTKK